MALDSLPFAGFGGDSPANSKAKKPMIVAKAAVKQRRGA
jgi:hypothetical protein